MHFHVITLFPEVMQVYTDASVLGRAQKTEKGKGAKVRGKKMEVHYYNPRDFTKNKHKKVDDRPYGGGPGMVMAAEPVLRAWEKAVGRKVQAESRKPKAKSRIKTLIMSPRGKKFDQKMAAKLAKEYDHLVLISGRYEGIDHRVKKALKAEEVSVGDYVVTGGELPALTVIDATARHIPGVLGETRSLEEYRTAAAELYTRPEVLKWKGKEYKVPKILLEGHHTKIEEWRKKRSNS